MSTTRNPLRLSVSISTQESDPAKVAQSPADWTDESPAADAIVGALLDMPLLPESAAEVAILFNGPEQTPTLIPPFSNNIVSQTNRSSESSDSYNTTPDSAVIGDSADRTRAYSASRWPAWLRSFQEWLTGNPQDAEQMNQNCPTDESLEMHPALASLDLLDAPLCEPDEQDACNADRNSCHHLGPDIENRSNQSFQERQNMPSESRSIRPNRSANGLSLLHAESQSESEPEMEMESEGTVFDGLGGFRERLKEYNRCDVDDLESPPGGDWYSVSTVNGSYEQHHEAMIDSNGRGSEKSARTGKSPRGLNLDVDVETEVTVTSHDGLILCAKIFESPRAFQESPIASIFLVHSYLQDSRVILPVARRFSAAGFRVVTFDARGHGQSDGVRGRISGTEWQSDLIAVIKSCSIEHIPNLIYGHGMGACVAAALCGTKTGDYQKPPCSFFDDYEPSLSDSDSSPNSMSTNDIPPVHGVMLVSPWIKACRPVRSSSSNSLSLANVKKNLSSSSLSSMGSSTSSHQPLPPRARLMSPDPICDISPYVLNSSLNQAWNLAADVLNMASSMTLPMLLIHGDADQFFEKYDGANKTLHIWPGASHELTNEQLDEVLSLAVVWSFHQSRLIYQKREAELINYDEQMRCSGMRDSSESQSVA